MNAPISREEQFAMLREALSDAHEKGYSRVSIEITRGGTLKVEVERTAEAPVRQYATGRKR